MKVVRNGMSIWLSGLDDDAVDCAKGHPGVRELQRRRAWARWTSYRSGRRDGKTRVYSDVIAIVFRCSSD